MRAAAILFLLPLASLADEKPSILDLEVPEHAATAPVSGGGHCGWRLEGINRNLAPGGKEHDPDVILVGDSITELWWKAEHGAPSWRKHFAGRRAANLGSAGDMTQNTLWRLKNGNLEGVDAKVAFVMVGGNNPASHSESQVADGVLAVVKEIKVRCPSAQVVVFGVFPRGHEAGTERRLRIRRINALLKIRLHFRDVHFYDIWRSFVEADGSLKKELFWDEVHLSNAGHEVWASKMLPFIEAFESLYAEAK